MGLFDALKKASADRAGGTAAVLPSSPVVPAATPIAHQASLGARRLLFVGADTAWFDQIQRDLVGLQTSWLCSHVSDCAGAVEKWNSGEFNTLVLDGKTPGSANLLQTLARELGQSICIVRCTVLDRTTSAQWKGTGATLIPEDTDAPALVATIKRSIRIRDWMADAAIKKLVAQIRKLPAQPKLHTQVTEELQSAAGSMDVVGQLIAQEPVMSAKILQVVNSAFFGLTREVSDATESVMVLGAERIKALILLAGVFSQYSGSKCPSFAPETVWNHCLQVGVFARSITLAETKNPRLAEAAFTAGLLHDIGKLVLAGNLPEMYDTVQRLKQSKQITSREAELEILGTTHAELGACLLATWGLPLPILEAIAWHHKPACSDEKSFSLLAAVHAANAFTQENLPGDAPREVIDISYLMHAGLGDCRNRWREICGVPTKTHEETPDEQQRRRREAKVN